MMLSQVRAELDALRSTVARKDAALIDLLLERITTWRRDQTTASQLMSDLARTLSERSNDQQHAKALRILESFRPTVASLGGMTMNERLVMFELMDDWDGSSLDDRAGLYTKLEAKPLRLSR